MDKTLKKSELRPHFNLYWELPRLTAIRAVVWATTRLRLGVGLRLGSQERLNYIAIIEDEICAKGNSSETRSHLGLD